MTESAAICDLGLQPYPAVHALQVVLAARRRLGTLATDLFLGVEHPPVFTLGRRGNKEHLGVSETFLRERNIAVVPIERGGEITYHGPGQLVLYPIINLRQARLRVSDYVYLLEELMLRLTADFGVQASRDARNHGIWVGNSKLGSIGIAIRHGITFHGLALNVDLDLEPFSWINPCGLRDVGMTSLIQEGATACTMDRVKARLQHHLTEVFGVLLHTVSPPSLVDTENMNIFVAEYQHLDSINEIRNAINKDKSSYHQLSNIDKYEIEKTIDRITFITTIDEIVVGYLTLHRFDILCKNDDAIFEMFVLPEHQRKGIGNAFIKHAEKYIKENMTFKRLVLGVLHSNTRAIKLYKRHNFIEIKSDPKGMYMAKYI